MPGHGPLIEWAVDTERHCFHPGPEDNAFEFEEDAPRRSPHVAEGEGSIRGDEDFDKNLNIINDSSAEASQILTTTL